MSKTVTLRLNDELYNLFRKFAEEDNRTLSNFIEIVAKRYIEAQEFVDEFEMEEIRNNKPLNESLKRGYKDTKLKKGQFIGGGITHDQTAQGGF